MPHHTQETQTATYEERRERHYRDLHRRARLAIRRKAEAGGISGPAPLGYLNARTPTGETAVEVDRAVAPLVRDAFALLSQKGASLRSVLAKITERGLRGRRGTPLSYSSFQGMVTNPFYAGYVRLNGEVHRGIHEAIVPERLFFEVQGKLGERSKKPAAPRW